MTDPRAFGQYVESEVEERVERVVARMTVPELVGQMVGVYPHEDVLAVVDPGGERRVEPGTFEVCVGDATATAEVERRRNDGEWA